MSGDGMSSMIQALVAPSSGTGITSSALWTEASAAAPLIITLFVFGFGFGIVRKLLKSRGGKTKI